MPISTTGRDDRAAVDKAISLLAELGSLGGAAAGVSELARRTDMSKSTAYRLLEVLVRNGVVERSGSGYRLGGRLHELGRSVYAPGHDQLRDLLIPELTELFQATGETVHLAVLRGSDVVYLAKLYGRRQVRSPSRIGGRAPAHCTAVGKALLAYDLGDVAGQLDGPLRRFTPHTHGDSRSLQTELSRVSQEGVAFDRQEIQLGLECVAMPVADASGRPVAALSVSGAAGHIDLGRHARTLRRVAHAASATLTRHMRRAERVSDAGGAA